MTTRPSYHVRELVHAHAVGLDALISQDVVGQDPEAGGEPGEFALGLLLRGTVGLTYGVNTRRETSQSFFVFLCVYK